MITAVAVTCKLQHVTGRQNVRMDLMNTCVTVLMRLETPTWFVYIFDICDMFSVFFSEKNTLCLIVVSLPTDCRVNIVLRIILLVIPLICFCYCEGWHCNHANH